MYPVTLGVICFAVWIVGWLIDPTFLPPGSLEGGLSTSTAPAVFLVGAIGVVLNHRLHVWLRRRRGASPDLDRVEDYWELQLVLGILTTVASLIQLGEGAGVAWGLFGIFFGVYTTATSGAGYARARRAVPEPNADAGHDRAADSSDAPDSIVGGGPAIQHTAGAPRRRRRRTSRAAFVLFILMMAAAFATLHCLPRPQTTAASAGPSEEEATRE